MTRRHAIAAGLGALGACGYAWRERHGLRRDDLDSSPPAGLPPSLGSLLTYATLAPSGHNTQPWMVGVASDGSLRVGSDRGRWLPYVDPLNRELALSIGAFLGNLMVAAPALGYRADYRVTGNQPTEEELLQIQLSPAPAADAGVLAQLRQRRTVRGSQLRDPLSSAVVRLWARQAGLSSWAEAHTRFFPRDSAEGRALAEATIEANRAQAGRDGAQAELAQWIRLSNEEARLQRDGLTQESMEIAGLAGWYVRHFMDRSSVMGNTFRDQGVDRVRQQVESCGGWLMVTSADSSLVSLVDTGRQTEQLWLRARDLRIGIHPMTQVLEEPPFCEQIGRQIGLSNPIQFILRLGFVKDYPAPVSLRRSVASIVQRRA